MCRFITSVIIGFLTVIAVIVAIIAFLIFAAVSIIMVYEGLAHGWWAVLEEFNEACGNAWFTLAFIVGFVVFIIMMWSVGEWIREDSGKKKAEK